MLVLDIAMTLGRYGLTGALAGGLTILALGLVWYVAVLTRWCGENKGIGVLAGLSRVLGTLFVGMLIVLVLASGVLLATANIG